MVLFMRGGFYSLIDTRQPIGRIEKDFRSINPNVILSNERFYEEAREKLGPTVNIVKVEDIIHEGNIDENMLAGIRKQAASTDPLYVNLRVVLLVCQRVLLLDMDLSLTLFRNL